MVDLNSFTFTQESDVVEVFDEQIFNDTLVETLSGDDLIENFTESVFPDFGILNDSSSTIDMGDGNDSISGSGSEGGILNKGTIKMGSGDDYLKGSGFTGIINDETIVTGQGNDEIQGVGYYGITNNGTIVTGKGDDLIGFGSDPSYGITNHGRISMGAGNDSIDASTYYGGIYNYGTINMGSGHDALTGTGKFDGILNYGTINMGAGNDSIVGNAGGSGIGNDGTINMGAGNDVINSSFLDGVGTIDLGGDDDLIQGGWRGEEEIKIDGGTGFDQAELYIDLNEVEISLISDNSLVLKGSEGEMTLTDIELLELNGLSFSFGELSELSILNFTDNQLT